MIRYALLLAILVYAGFLRLYRSDAVPAGLCSEEAAEGNAALRALEQNQFLVFYPANSGREGLYVNAAAVGIHYLGNTAAVLRLPAAIFGILTVWGVYALAAEIFTPPVGLVAAFFMAASFWHVLFSRLAFRAIAAPCLLAWSLYFLLSAMRRIRQGKRYLPLAAMAGLVYGLGFYTYIAYRTTPVLMLGVLLWHHLHTRHKRPDAAIKAAVVFVLLAGMAAWPLGRYFFRNPEQFFGRTAEISILNSPHAAAELLINCWQTIRMFFAGGDADWRHNLAGRAELFWPVAILLLIGVFVRATGRGIALAWLALAAVGVVLCDQGVPNALRSILMAPPIYILAALGAYWVYATLATRLPAVVLAPTAAAILLALAYEPYHVYFVRWAPNPHVAEAFQERTAKMARAINALPRYVPKTVVADDDAPAWSLMYLTGSYTDRERDAVNIRYVIPGVCGQVTGEHVFCVK